VEKGGISILCAGAMLTCRKRKELAITLTDESARRFNSVGGVQRHNDPSARIRQAPTFSIRPVLLHGEERIRFRLD
jgi:hypothetical protein